MNPNNTKFLPIISSIQKISIYETKSVIYLIGSNNKQTRFRVLHIGRKSTELQIYEDPNEYEIKEIKRFVGNLKYTKTISAYGIIGFVKFVEGYYLLLITKRNKIAVLGMHVIYTIKDTTMYRITDIPNKTSSPHEIKYQKMFMSIDLNSNFYFSYSYDLSQTYQYNNAEPKYVGEKIDFEYDPLDWTNTSKEERLYAFRSNSRKRFVWNDFLLKPLLSKVLHKDWMLDIIHGFTSQSSISIFGRPIYICLIARRSTKFAGTRFLKRGANHSGDVANEVETEQIVMDGQRICSFVQIRGSIPSHWSQNQQQKLTKPPISLDLTDPYAEAAGRHFERLLFDYGAPVIILNLVKKREKRKHESILTDEMVKSIKYLNQFLPAHSKIKYNHFDMARRNRTDKNVMESLAVIAENMIQQTGIFYMDSKEMSQQNGIIRVNCVDCLDRTNTAQFAVGKSVLAHQLYRLGFLNKPPKLEFDSDCVTMLESLYELHGDTLALQYGGSQLVHRIKTYRKTAPWTSQGNDIMQTISRYYSNTFSDTEKQQAINLFLGYFIPEADGENQEPLLWELTSDYTMHNPVVLFPENKTKPLTKWISDVIAKNLPNSANNENKTVKELIRVHSKELEMIDLYSNYHLTFQLTSFEENIAFQISHLARNFMPTFRTNFSPFESVKRGIERNVNPSLTGKSSTSSTTSNSSSSDEMDDGDSTNDEDDAITDQQKSVQVSKSVTTVKFCLEEVFPSCMDIYGFEIQPLKKDQHLKYKGYVSFYKRSSPAPTIPKVASEKISERPQQKHKAVQLISLTDYKDHYEAIDPPIVSKASTDAFNNYCKLVINVNYDKKYSNQDILEKYVNFIV